MEYRRIAKQIELESVLLPKTSLLKDIEITVLLEEALISNKNDRIDKVGVLAARWYSFSRHYKTKIC